MIENISKVIITTILVYETSCKHILSIIQMIIKRKCHDIKGFITDFSLQMFKEVFKTFRNSFSNIKPENIIKIKYKIYFPKNIRFSYQNFL